MLKKYLVTFIVVAGILFMLMYPKVYVVRDGANGTLFWNADQALLFVDVTSSGAHMSYARYALEPLLVSMGDVRTPDNKRCSQILVIRVTDNDVQRYDTDLYQYAEDPYCGFHFDLFAGNIYAVYLPKLWKWVGTDFEPAAVEENDFQAGRATSTAASRAHPWEFDNMDGWSMRTLGQTPPRHEIVLNGQPVTIVFHGETWPSAPVSVDLIRPGQPPQTIWSLDGRPHRVSKAEYMKIFGNP
jgi:hypothetical protein